jgi:hypothetical protein
VVRSAASPSSPWSASMISTAKARSPCAVAAHARSALDKRRTGRTRLIGSEHGDQPTLFGAAAAEEERELLLHSS